MQNCLIRRSRLQVLIEILHICKMPQPKTRVMQKANLSYTALQDCLKKLQELELVDKSPDSQKYATTQKGTLFLAKWMQLQEVLNPKEKLPIKTQKRHF